jgi:hypothetical protein
MILMPQFLESLLLLLFASTIGNFVAFIYCLCLFELGTIVLEPLFGDFQEQGFDESLFHFEEQKGKCP